MQAPGGGFVWDMPHVQSAPAAATAAGMSAASAPAPRRWEGVDQALERMVLRACLDQAPERRRVRDAFKDVQLSIDHCLFKVPPSAFPPIFFPFLFFTSLHAPFWKLESR